MKKMRANAVDLWERIKTHKNSLKEEDIVDMIENELIMVVQDHVNSSVFKHNKKSGSKKTRLEDELKVLLQKAEEYAEETSGYLEASYQCASELERETGEDQFIAAKLNLLDVGSNGATIQKKIEFIKKQLGWE